MRYIYLIFLGLLFCFGQNCAASSNDSESTKSTHDIKQAKTISLNMIVKNETEVIRRCLASVKPMIDYWVIVDTGSTDGTQEMIKEFMKDIPGELHERPWVNFAHNRTEALQLANGKADYLLFIDADETLIFTDDFKLPDLNKDIYYITAEFGGTKYARVRLINNHLDWKWVGVLHESVESPQAHTSETLKGVVNFITTEGARSKDPQKFQKDAQLLEKGLIDEPNNTRYVFYLAQSYRDAGEPELALKNYQKRIVMGGTWDQEIFYSMLQVGLLQEKLKMPTETIVNSYYKAYAYRPSRLEPLYHLASFHRRNGDYQAGYAVANQGLNMRSSNDILFVDHWIYDYGLLLEYSICAYWVEKYNEAYLASSLLLANTALPASVRECVQKNLPWINTKIAESKHKLTKEIPLAWSPILSK